jgi:hypothetical protein
LHAAGWRFVLDDVAVDHRDLFRHVGRQVVVGRRRLPELDEPAELGHDAVAAERLEQVLVGARLQLLVQIEGLLGLLGGGEHERDPLQLGRV